MLHPTPGPQGPHIVALLSLLVAVISLTNVVLLLSVSDSEIGHSLLIAALCVVLTTVGWQRRIPFVGQALNAALRAHQRPLLLAVGVSMPVLVGLGLPFTLPLGAAWVTCVLVIVMISD
ncbi:hypothetical protein [Deinococcus marmoris]|uniref:hypothetical protein n=1 Tax=Deinococcus marmoris TaxID=249408 RepID=UPI00096A4402|nr:hypothetical protein [Deinococcus marmoris]